MSPGALMCISGAVPLFITGFKEMPIRTLDPNQMTERTWLTLESISWWSAHILIYYFSHPRVQADLNHKMLEYIDAPVTKRYSLLSGTKWKRTHRRWSDTFLQQLWDQFHFWDLHMRTKTWYSPHWILTWEILEKLFGPLFMDYFIVLQNIKRKKDDKSLLYA